MRVTPEFFSTYGVRALRGRTLGAADAAGSAVVVLSHGFWQHELGGDEAVVGSAVTLSDIPYTVVGVMPAEFDVRLLDWNLDPNGWPARGSDGIGREVGRFR